MMFDEKQQCEDQITIKMDGVEFRKMKMAKNFGVHFDSSFKYLYESH